MFHWRTGYSMNRIHAGRALALAAGLFLVFWVQFAHFSSAQARVRRFSIADPLPQKQSTRGHSTQEIEALKLGKPVESELSGGQFQSYHLTLTQGQYVKLTVQQRGVDVVARLLAPNGQLIADVDSDRTAQGSERVELVSEAAGTYKIEIVPSLPRADMGTYTIQLSEAREATEDEKLLHEARKQYYESLRLTEAGNGDKAIDFANRALAAREKILGSSHKDVAASLLSLGGSYWSKGDHTRAEEALQRAMRLTARSSGTETLDYADVLHALAKVRFSTGEHEQAEELNLRALSIREKFMGPDSVAAASSLQNLAVLYRTTNDLPKAEQMYLRALAIRENLLGPNHLEVSILLNLLGLLYYGAGDYNSAEPIFQRSLAIKEKELGDSHRQVAIALNNLGLVEWKRGDYKNAEAYHRRAMSVYEKATGPESYGVGSSFHNLGIIYKEAGEDYAKAEEHYQRALVIWEKIFGEYDASVANALASLGILYEATGDYDRALKFRLRAQSIYEKVLGPNNHYTLLSLRGLADVYAVKGDIRRSMEYQLRLNAIEEKLIPLNLTIGSERQKLAYFRQLKGPETLISFHVNLASTNVGARDLAATKVMQRKGRVLDALSENLLALRQRSNSHDRALLDRLGDVNSRLARLVLNGPRKTPPEEYQKQVNTLEEERENLETEISRRTAGFFEVSRPVTLPAVQALVPSDAALVEFAVYAPVDLRAPDHKKRYGAPRYIAYVIRHKGEVRWAELGTAKEIDERINALRKALRDPERKDVRQLARAVDEKLMQPVRALAGDAKQLLISPDGELNLIPFETLVDEQGRYLVERFAFAYLSSGRDLQRLQTRRESKSSPVVLADPAFGEPAVIAVNGSLRDSTAAGSRVEFNYSRFFFGPLPGVGAEVRALKELLPQATFLTKEQATEATLKRVAGPSILHVATHGFFLQNEPPAGTQMAVKAAEETRLGKWVAQIENPLLRSGLALAGANQGRSGNDDGILTALEATGLDLWGTKLVVLSACDTGVGEVKNGHGVYGLRRALFLAGAESQLMSLWPVSDRSTRDLMIGYYKGLVQNAGRAEALRRVQLQMLRSKSHAHPYYWASFILAGEWANLQGQR